MTETQVLANQLKDRFSEQLQSIVVAYDEVTIEIAREDLLTVCAVLRDEADFKFELLMDVCGVDYSLYGVSQWQTETATLTGFERGVDLSQEDRMVPWDKPRFAVVYHLLSLTHNQRLRVRIFAESEPPIVDSVIEIWNTANWHEREVFDLFGILFKGHPDLRRILTDYGFIGHPFRKDFPLIGNVEVRYDAAQERVIYEPVSITPRTLVPRVIRHDSRYAATESGEKHG